MSWKPHIVSRLQGVWRNRTEPESMRALAAVYWEVLVLIGIAAVICTIFLAVQELGLVVEAQSPPPAAQTSGGPALDRTQLDATLTQYENRAAQYRSIASSSPAVIPDPSK